MRIKVTAIEIAGAIVIAACSSAAYAERSSRATLVSNLQLHTSGYVPIESRDLVRLLAGNTIRPAYDTASFRIPVLTETFLEGGKYIAAGRGVRLVGNYEILARAVCVQTQKYPNHCFQFARSADGRIFKIWRSSTTNSMQVSVERATNEVTP